ncbi:peptidase C65 Otubain-domain-containing protein [Kockovaella imperatae]|uniref:ubiquitinyl hydrolase 1 n=1 Tax=Kockovaella imperatae TaxID=4999 RepID=A0A1Y1UT00_9TREE|nr:peptidase C65 Otubain-domain-containing protein [Kockovaella imperatae]ORX40654.1 peptidase C65 Otubain-domain-containing protein [Kockovaella imperatae]
MSDHDGGDADPARVIDEHTDMTTLTDQEIMRLTESMGQEDVTSRPLISAPVPLSVIRDEYKNGSSTVLKKIDWLQANGWDQVWRARGDGDCFYRSFTIAYFLRILHSSEPQLQANLAFDAVQRALPAMQQVGFDPDLYEEFLEPLLVLLRGFDADTPTEWTLIQQLQDAERSNCIVVALRLVTSAYIRTHEDVFSPFLLSPTTFLPLTTDDFCRQEVEPCGKEADHAQIMALSEALHMGVRIAYLDRSEVQDINWVSFGPETEDPLTLLYRPGHYDVVTKDHLLA